MTKKKIVICTGILLCLLNLTACTFKQNTQGNTTSLKEETRRESNRNVREMVVAFNLDGSSTEMFIDNAWFNRNRFIGGILFQGLLVAEGNMNNIQPDLCSEFSISPDGLTYVFRLKDNLYWHDGNPLTMEDVTWSIETCLRAQKVNGYLKKVLQRIEGAKAYEFGGSNVLTGMRVEGEYLILQISQRDDSFLSGLAQLAILPKHCFKQAEPDDIENSDFWNYPIGSGPYKIREIKGDHDHQEILFEVNKEYSGNIPKIERIRCMMFEDIPNGEFDFAMTSDPEIISKYDEHPDYEAVQTRNLYYRYLMLNIDGNNGAGGKFLQNGNIRKALYMGLDRKRIIEEIYQGTAILMNTGIDEDSVWYDESLKEKALYDPGRAKEILLEEGFDFEEPLILTRYSQDKLSVELLEKIAESWKELGLNIEIKPMNASDTDRLWSDSGWYHVGLKNLAAVDYSEWYYEYSSNNQLWSNVLNNRREFDPLINSLNHSSWAYERKEIYNQLQHMELEYIYKIPLAIVPQYVIYNSKNIDLPPMDFPNLWYYFDIGIEDWHFRE